MGKSQIVPAASRATRMASHTFFANHQKKKDFGVSGRPHIPTRPWYPVHRRPSFAAIEMMLPSRALVQPLAAVGTATAEVRPGVASVEGRAAAKRVAAGYGLYAR